MKLQLKLPKEKGSFPFLESHGSREAFVKGNYIQKGSLNISMMVY